MTKFIILLIFVLIKIVNYCDSFSYPELKLLNVIFRHGDREPNEERNGDLTIAGRRRAYHLGEVLRSKYGDFLGDIYVPASVSARSTEYVRAKISLQLLLAALYTPVKHQKWHESLAWQPIPFSYALSNNDALLFPIFCPRFKRKALKVQLMPEFQKLLLPYQEMLNNLTIITGKEKKTSYDMFNLYHELVAINSMNKTLPAWSETIFPDGLLLNGTYLEYDYLKFTDWMRKFNGGALIRKIVDDMLKKTDIKLENKRKIFLYSSHEVLIMAILKTLKIWEAHIPEYSSAIIIELREDRGNYYVKVLYYKGVTEAFKEMQIPGCPSLCPLVRFIELISDQLPTYNEIICDDKPVNFADEMS